MSKFLDRFKEPSSHAGLAAILGGLGMILKSPETVTVAEKLPSIAERLSTQDYVGAAAILFGLSAIWIKEKK